MISEKNAEKDQLTMEEISSFLARCENMKQEYDPETHAEPESPNRFARELSWAAAVTMKAVGFLPRHVGVEYDGGIDFAWTYPVNADMRFGHTNWQRYGTFAVYNNGEVVAGIIPDLPEKPVVWGVASPNNIENMVEALRTIKRFMDTGEMPTDTAPA